MKEFLSTNDIILRDAPDVSAPMVFTTAGNSINLKFYRKVVAVLFITDAATGAVITMKQGSAAAASTALSFTKFFDKRDISASNAWVERTASSDTFTTETSSKTGIYAVELDASQLTDGNSFVRLNAASTADATGTLIYIVHRARFGAAPDDLRDASS